MNTAKQTVCDTVYVIAAFTIIAMLFPLVIARAEPDWQGFAMACTAIAIASPLLSRLLGWACQHLPRA